MLASVRSLRRWLSISFFALLASAVALTACDSAGPSSASEGDNVEVGFATSYASASAATATAKSNHDSLVVTGSNGTLTITDIRLIVSEVELEGDADSAEFEADPTFLDLPLDTNEVAPVATSEIPPGTYDEFEFEVEDIDLDENDDDERSLQALRETIRSAFPNWPEDAIMVVVGTFTPTGGTATSFTAYFEAEIEVERELSPPLAVTGDGLSRSLIVKLDPTRWLSNADGTVRNLAQFDYASIDDLIEFEAEFEDGVAEIEVDGEDDDDDDDGESDEDAEDDDDEDDDD
mgnify:CR=1 FL=1